MLQACYEVVSHFPLIVHGCCPCAKLAIYAQENSPQSHVPDCVFTLETSMVKTSWLVLTNLAKITWMTVLTLAFNESYTVILASFFKVEPVIIIDMQNLH